MLTKRTKAATIKKVAIHDKDTGSTPVQVAILTKKIEELTEHLKKNKKDLHSRRGLLQMVADRRSHMRYLEANNKRAYNALTKTLGMKK